MDFKKELSLFDLTSIVVGSVIGADIYIASAITAGMLGPFSIVIWVIAGIFAMVIALVFAYCSYYIPKVGGLSPMYLKHLTIFMDFLAAGACGLPR
jgi:basic amino acid/polyamine antiporter, APA family